MNRLASNYPSLERRGGCGINPILRGLRIAADGVVRSGESSGLRAFAERTNPSARTKVASRYFMGRAATPASQGGEFGRLAIRLYAHKFRACQWICILLLFAATSCRQSMANEPRYRTYQESGFFPNGSSARPIPEGTVSQEADLDPHLISGTVNGQLSDTFPFPITLDVLHRGQQRYDIFCTPCHDHVGTGNGMAALRGFRMPPPSFHIDRLRQAPPGYFFDVMTKGYGVMPSYAFQIPIRDRWAIAAYVRVLQLSWTATTADVPPDELQKLEAQKQ